jgi:hypothetical protein
MKFSVEDMENGITQWLGDEFDEDQELASLKITLPNEFPLETTVEYERVSRILIEPKYIVFFRSEG